MSSDNLTVHLKLDNITINADDDSAIVKDINGNEIDVFVSGNPEVVDDELFGKCLSFDGSSYIDISGSAVSNHDEADFTVSVWAKLEDDQATDSSPITFRATPVNNETTTTTIAETEGYSFFVNDQNKWTIFLGDGTSDGAEIGEADIIDSWTNLTITHNILGENGPELCFYINGQKQASRLEVFVPVSSATTPLRIGAGGTEAATGEEVTYHFIGKIAHLRIYDTALSDTEVWEMLLSSMKIENAEDITNRINNLNPDDLISLLTTMRQEKDLLEEIESLDDQQREEITSALKEYRLDDNWKSMMEIFNIN
ncbi:MAG: hypothetical protein F6K23_27725 [Okeania sp. SIO2C9]|uniref:LamG-like jellyroll fold domain-containing protein n=1 Tax=Okeania sp. SIO2C9 TaxID=2607791 RepID=UPI0013C11DA9|nr:LamG-like jellyroll fold domain-containing protein [Okeania sp. SIO2C9]NEQ76491.1 hypothetical protein [Okeania sp. SIO2C9]